MTKVIMPKPNTLKIDQDFVCITGVSVVKETHCLGVGAVMVGHPVTNRV